MSNYTKSTNFASKDTLPAGDALKIVRGSEINTEFDNIQTAIESKADTASPTFTGTPAAPTASVGTNTTQLATTALVFAAMQALYPVGTIYSNISVSTNPGTLFGFGTWTAIAGRVVVGLDSGDSSFDTVGETGGAKDATLVSHTHTINDSGHVHAIPQGSAAANGAGTVDLVSGDDFTSQITYYHNSNSATTGISLNSTGSSATNANLQPYVVAYVWKRTA